MQTIATWQALIAALAGASLAFVGVWWNSRSNLAQLKLRLDHEDKQLKLRLESEERLHYERIDRERLEELYMLACTWVNGVTDYQLELKSIMGTWLNPKEFAKEWSKIGEPFPPEFNRIDMIVHMQEYSVIDTLNAAVKLVQKTSDIGNQYINNGELGQPNDKCIKEFDAVQEEFLEAGIALKMAIIMVYRNA